MINEIKMNLIQLNDLISDKFTAKILPAILEYLKVDKYSPYDINDFLKNIINKNNSYIKLKDLYEEYTIWYNKYDIEDSMMTKSDFKIFSENYINNKWKITYKLYSISNIKIRCWKNITFIKDLIN